MNFRQPDAVCIGALGSDTASLADKIAGMYNLEGSEIKKISDYMAESVQCHHNLSDTVSRISAIL